MSMQYSVAVRNARLDAVEDTIGASPKLQLRTGAPPANCAAADTGSLLCEINLPADWMAAAAAGAKSKLGTWSASATAAGVIGHFRIKDSGGSVHAQGTCTVAGGGGDMTVDALSVASQQVVTVTAFTLTSAKATP